MLRARTEGLAAVWASGFRARDGQRTSVLGAAPGASEEHAVWLATPEQVAVLDRCEGRGDRYRLARLGTGAVHTDDGLRIEAPWCYLGLSAIRRPLLVGREPGALRRPRPGRGVRRSTACRPRTTGCRPSPCAVRRTPTSGPPAVFVYGTLQPGHPAWPLLAEHAVGRPRRATVAGQVCDTGFGYPALLPDGSSRAPGWVVTVRDPVSALDHLDRYEGSEYRRIRVAAAPDDGPRTACWTYAWAADDGRLTALPGGWTG